MEIAPSPPDADSITAVIARAMLRGQGLKEGAVKTTNIRYQEKTLMTWLGIWARNIRSDGRPSLIYRRRIRAGPGPTRKSRNLDAAARSMSTAMEATRNAASARCSVGYPQSHAPPKGKRRP